MGRNRLIGFFAVIALLVVGFELQGHFTRRGSAKPNKLKLYWFIPDGLRADPDVFKIYEWAAQGELPNIKKLMDRGASGYSIPVFPSHTPVNYATLLTGTMPLVHGVADGPMHIEGAPLSTVSIGGFRSVARRIPAVWSLFEQNGLKVGLVSTPGSTPPEIESGLIVRGRWGGWGQDLHAINFEKKTPTTALLASRKMFFSGPELTQYIDFSPAGKWLSSPPSSPPRFFTMRAWGAEFYAALIHSKDSDAVAFSIDGKEITVTLKVGEWSPWYPVQIKLGERALDSNVRFHVIKLGQDGFFRVRVLFNNLNSTVTQPETLAADLTSHVGPMVDFVDNYPPQLIQYDEDEKSFLEEMGFSFAWHTKLISYFLQTYAPDVVIHSIYNPNQMLTSRWWMGHVDPQGLNFSSDSPELRLRKWSDVKGMYKKIDAMLGEILAHADANTLIVLSSDHGVAPLRKLVKLNNLLAMKGLLHFKKDSKTGEFAVDWPNTTAIYLQMDGIYINPNGLDGPWKRGTGPEYEKLRRRVSDLLQELKDEDGIHPVAKAVKWEDAGAMLSLPSDRVGDLIVANRAGYGWSEEISEQKDVFSIPLHTGYKQAILTDESKSMWTPFIMAGPGIKKGFQLERPIRHVDQLPTILKIMGIANPQKMDGRVLQEALE